MSVLHLLRRPGWEARVGSLRGVEPPSKATYYVANAVSLANRFMFTSRVLPWASIPADIIVDRYEQANGTADHIGKNLRVPLLREGPFVSEEQKKLLGNATTAFSFLTMISTFGALWFLVPPLGMYVAGFQTVDPEPNTDPNVDPNAEPNEGAAPAELTPKEGN